MFGNQIATLTMLTRKLPIDERIQDQTITIATANACTDFFSGGGLVDNTAHLNPNSIYVAGNAESDCVYPASFYVHLISVCDGMRCLVSCEKWTHFGLVLECSACTHGCNNADWDESIHAECRDVCSSERNVLCLLGAIN